ncbi:MAG: class D sortase [Sulfobacillus thermotolerans]|nr:class D sortase [Sulfobacillus thermotolerans]
MRRTFAISLAALGLGMLAIPLWIGPAVQWTSQFAAPLPTVKPSRTIQPSQSLSPEPQSLQAAPLQDNPKLGQRCATLWIPSLHLKVPVVQGTAYGELLLAAGHYPGSVMPGQLGTSVIAAHNATYFRHLNQLRPGNRLIVTTSQGTFWFDVTGHEIVSDTAGLPVSPASTLDLEACDPLNALYLTPNRYIVESRLVRSVLTDHATPRVLMPPASPYHAMIPSFVTDHYSLSLQDNSLPMGTLRYQDAGTAADFTYQQSVLPLQAATEAVNLWLAFKDASQVDNSSAMQALWTHAVGNPYVNAKAIAFPGTLSLLFRLNASGQPLAITLRDPFVRINNQLFSVTMDTKFTGHTLFIRQVHFERLMSSGGAS